MKLTLFILTISSTIVHAQVQPFPSTRTALVMGAWNYSDSTFPELKGIEKDVERMAAKLGELGFKVTTVKNPTLSHAKKAVDAFGAELKSRGGGGVFYFSGHGAEHEGKNYLIPIGTAISSRNDLDDEALVANRVLGRMEESENQVNLVFLDCCRNEMSKAGGIDGLAPMKARGSLIGFATASGKVAFSTNDGSPYTASLVKHLGDPGLSLSDMHTVVASEVQQIAKQIGTDQRPGQYVELGGLFHMVPLTSSQQLPQQDLIHLPTEETAARSKTVPKAPDQLPIFKPGTGATIIR